MNTGITEVFEKIATTPVPTYTLGEKKGLDAVIKEDPKGENEVNESNKDSVFRLSSAMPKSTN